MHYKFSFPDYSANGKNTSTEAFSNHNKIWHNIFILKSNIFPVLPNPDWISSATVITYAFYKYQIIFQKSFWSNILFPHLLEIISKTNAAYLFDCVNFLSNWLKTSSPSCSVLGNGRYSYPSGALSCRCLLSHMN